MPCDAAISIAKATIKEENLLKMLQPEVVEQILRAWAQARGVPENRIDARFLREGAWIALPGLRIVIRNGQIEVSPSDIKALNEIKDLLKAAASRLLAEQIRAILSKTARSYNGSVDANSVAVTNEGVRQQAMLLTLKI